MATVVGLAAIGQSGIRCCVGGLRSRDADERLARTLPDRNREPRHELRPAARRREVIPRRERDHESELGNAQSSLTQPHLAEPYVTTPDSHPVPCSHRLGPNEVRGMSRRHVRSGDRPTGHDPTGRCDRRRHAHDSQGAEQRHRLRPESRRRRWWHGTAAVQRRVRASFLVLELRRRQRHVLQG